MNAAATNRILRPTTDTAVVFAVAVRLAGIVHRGILLDVLERN